MDGAVLLIVVVVLLAVVVAIVAGIYQGMRRRKQLRAVAERMGYSYSEHGAGQADAVTGFALFSQGYSRNAWNLLSTEANGVAATAMDYRYELGQHSSKNRRIVTQSVLLLESDRLDLPAFLLRPEGLSQKLAGAMGQQDIDFENQPDFSAAYVLQGDDEPRVRALFGREKLAFFAGHRGLCIEGYGRKLLYYRAKKLVSPEAIPSFIADGLAILDLLAGKGAPSPSSAPDPLAGLDEVLAEIGTEGETPAGEE